MKNLELAPAKIKKDQELLSVLEACPSVAKSNLCELRQALQEKGRFSLVLTVFESENLGRITTQIDRTDSGLFLFDHKTCV